MKPALLLLAIALLEPTALGEVRVDLLPEAAAGSDVVRVKDVATIKADDPALARRLGDLPLLAAPDPGHTVKLRRVFVERVVEAGAAGEGQVTVSGAESVEVRRGGAVVQTDEVLEAIKRYVATEARRLGLDLDAEWARPPQLLPVGGDAYEITVHPLSPELDGTVFFRVLVSEPGRLQKELVASVTVRRFEFALVAARNIPRGALVQETDLLPARLDATRMGSRERESLIRSMDGVAGKEARTPIEAGRPVTLSMVAEPTLIAPGDPITLEVRCGAVRVSAPAVARQAGALGDMIRVENRATGKTQYAEVVAPGLATLR